MLDKPLVTTRAVCGRCGGEFFYERRSGAQRTYCDDCRGRADRLPVPLPQPSEIAGRPFTIGHFRAWTAELRLKGGAPFVLELWEERFVEDVFAGFSECWLIVPEGNGKSTLIAVLILYCCEFADEAAIPVAASARDQAKIIYDQGAGFVRRSPSLRGRFESKPGLRELVFGESSRAKIFASDAGVGDGIIPTPIEVLDELHRHRDLELYRTWAGKLDKEDAQLVVISTAGSPGSEFEELREKMRQSAAQVKRDGRCFGRYAGETSVLHEYAVPEDGDAEDLELVKEANPSSRITVESLRAKRARPSWNLAHWRRLTCNIPTRAEGAAVTEAEWAAAKGKRIPASVPVWVGLDLGWRKDPHAIVALWWKSAHERLLGQVTVIDPPDDGGSTHPDEVKRALLSLHARNPIDTVVMDPTAGEDIAAWIEDELGARVIEHSQSLSAQVLACARFMEGLRNGWLKHDGDAQLTRHVLNAVARELPRGEIVFERPHKSRFGDQTRRRVDSLDAAAMVNAVAAGELLAAETPAMSWGPA